MLDEVQKRTEAYNAYGEANSVRILLGDCKEWAFLKPSLQIHPVFKDGRVVRAWYSIGYEDKVDSLIEAVGDGGDGTISKVASLAAWILRKQYDLSEHDLDQLLCFRSDDADPMAWTRHVMRAATGEHGLFEMPPDKE